MSEAQTAPAQFPRGRRNEKVGVVVGNRMTKGVVVEVERLVRHTQYRRVIRRRAKFMAHDELGCNLGDKVRIVETRPLSARKRWRVLEVLQKGARAVDRPDLELEELLRRGKETASENEPVAGA